MLPDIIEGCKLIDNLSLAPNIQQAMAANQARQMGLEKLVKGSFWSRLVIDGLSTQPMIGSGNNSGRPYGFVGMHVILLSVDRFQIFGPPGVLLLRTTDYNGRHFHYAYTWGGGMKIGNFHLPFFWDEGKNATLYFTFMKCWIQGATPLPGVATSMDLFGISISHKKKE